MTPSATGVGFFELGRSYAHSAKLVDDAVSAGTLRISHHKPVDYLYAHAIELMLKGSLLEHDPGINVENYRHDLLGLYDEAKSRRVLDGLIDSVEKAVKNRWRGHLREERDKYQAALGIGPSTDEGEEFGVFGNEVIGKELPELRRQIIWLSARHKDNGGKFRYLQPGLDSREQVQAFGVSIDVVRWTSYWACEEMYDHFRKHRR